MSMGKGESLSGDMLQQGSAQAPHQKLDQTLPLPQPESPGPRILLRGSLARTVRDLPRPHLPSPIRFPAGPRASPGRPRSPHPVQQPGLGAGGSVLRPGALFTTRNKSAPSGPGRGVAAGSGPTLKLRWTLGRRAPALVQPQQFTAPRHPFRPRRTVSGPLPSAPAPTHHWPTQAPRAARVPRAPSLY